MVEKLVGPQKSRKGREGAGGRARHGGTPRGPELAGTGPDHTRGVGGCGVVPAEHGMGRGWWGMVVSGGGTWAAAAEARAWAGG